MEEIVMNRPGLTAGHGRLAWDYCHELLPLKVCMANSFYIGTWSSEGPCSRESVEYFKTREAAEEALKSGEWTKRLHP